MCSAIQARVLVDDALHYAQQCAGHLDHVRFWEYDVSWSRCDAVPRLPLFLTSALHVQVILFGDYAWNKAAGLPAGVTRALDWKAVQVVLRDLELQ
jgi:hypothetical protein